MVFLRFVNSEKFLHGLKLLDRNFQVNLPKKIHSMTIKRLNNLIQPSRIPKILKIKTQFNPKNLFFVIKLIALILFLMIIKI